MPIYKTDRTSTGTGGFDISAAALHIIAMALMLMDHLWATIFRSENLPYEADYGTPVTEIGEGENRKRMYYWHTYSYPFSEYVYEIGGSASDMKNWKQVSCRRFDKRVTD